jgi:hypothetical protein
MSDDPSWDQHVNAIFKKSQETPAFDAIVGLGVTSAYTTKNALSDRPLNIRVSCLTIQCDSSRPAHAAEVRPATNSIYHHRLKLL